jgi:hypothetical protein
VWSPRTSTAPSRSHVWHHPQKETKELHTSHMIGRVRLIPNSSVGLRGTARGRGRSRPGRHGPSRPVPGDRGRARAPRYGHVVPGDRGRARAAGYGPARPKTFPGAWTRARLGTAPYGPRRMPMAPCALRRALKDLNAQSPGP